VHASHPGPAEYAPLLPEVMSWKSAAAQIVFVRKRLGEVQYLRTTITDEQRKEFGNLVESNENLITLCTVCHNETHNRVEQETRRPRKLGGIPEGS
jgi:5-methylcytosine-specific restriction endonuclease McrA